ARDARFASNDLRGQNRAALKLELEGHLASVDAQSIADDLLRKGVPCSAVNNIEQALQHPHTRHRDMVVELDDYRGIAAPIKLGRSTASYRLAPPRLNQHGPDIDWLRDAQDEQE